MSSSPVSSISSTGSFCESPIATVSDLDYDGSSVSFDPSETDTLADEKAASVDGQERKKLNKASFIADFDLADYLKRLFADV